MEDRTRVIKIESVLGGQSPYNGFSAEDQFSYTYSVDCEPNGYLNPDSSPRFSGSFLNGAPLWIKAEPKGGLYYVYDSAGSVYSLNSNTITGVGDLNDGASAAGNGCEYYDNYMYFARATTVARYGPLNGTPTFTDAYWTSTLSKTALTDTTYPTNNDSDSVSLSLPNHVMHRHNDGNLYFSDVVGNQGVLHKISTTKTTVEGDTDNGSAFNAIDFPYGYWPTAIESLGESVVVALYSGEGNALGVGLPNQRAKIAFWDTTNPNTYARIIDFEFPDPIIYGIKNTNGILYFVSGDENLLRITRLVGEYSFEQITTLTNVSAPFPGGVDGAMNRFLFGIGYSGEGGVGCAGRERSGVGNEVFSVRGCTSTSNSRVTSVSAISGTVLSGWADNDGKYSIDGSDSTLTENPNSNPQWASSYFRIGQPFKIKAVKFLTEANLGQNIKVYALIDTAGDTGASVTEGTLLGNVSAENYGESSNTRVVLRPNSATGKNDFAIGFSWEAGLYNGGFSTIKLPITVEYELLDD